MRPAHICPCCRQYRQLNMNRGGLCDECAPVIEADDRERELREALVVVTRYERSLEEEREAWRDR